MVPLLERWLGNLLARQFEGRVSALTTRLFDGKLWGSWEVSKFFLLGVYTAYVYNI